MPIIYSLNRYFLKSCYLSNTVPGTLFSHGIKNNNKTNMTDPCLLGTNIPRFISLGLTAPDILIFTYSTNHLLDISSWGSKIKNLDLPSTQPTPPKQKAIPFLVFLLSVNGYFHSSRDPKIWWVPS